MIQKEPLVSIVIPTYNEEEDIKKTLDACVALTYPKKEIIVVDDSKDNTPNIVKGYAAHHVHLIHREKNDGGRSGARNVGILAAQGEILIILNADVLLPTNFIERILPHYEKGAGYVLVESEVINEEYLFPRFTSSLHRYTYTKPKNNATHYWSEGHSVLREAVLKAGLFPTPPLTLKAGEDGYFGEKIHRLGYKRVIDRSIVVRHYAPYRFKEFWKIMTERVSSLASYFLEHRSIGEIFFRTVLRTILVLLSILTIIPIIVMSYRIAMFSPHKWRDVIPFIYVYVIRQIAFLWGKWTSLLELLRYISTH